MVIEENTLGLTPNMSHRKVTLVIDRSLGVFLLSGQRLSLYVCTLWSLNTINYCNGIILQVGKLTQDFFCSSLKTHLTSCLSLSYFYLLLVKVIYALESAFIDWAPNIFIMKQFGRVSWPVLSLELSGLTPQEAPTWPQLIRNICYKIFLDSVTVHWPNSNQIQSVWYQVKGFGNAVFTTFL